MRGHMSFRLVGGLFAGLSLPLIAGGSAPAQSADQQPAASSGLDEIIVTARRREEKLQSVPISIIAFNGDYLREKAVTSTIDLNGLVPGFNLYESSRGNAGTVALRGLPGVVAYFAEVPSAQIVTGGGVEDVNLEGQSVFFDLDSLQVVTGPQGTLFGLNSTGGAFLIEPKRPKNDYEGYVDLTLGSYNWYKVEAAVNVPIVDDKLLLRVAGVRNERDGFTRDVQNDQYLDNADSWSWRAGLTFRPTDDIDNYLLYRGYYQNDNATSILIQGANCGKVFSTIGPTKIPLTLCDGVGYAGLLNKATQIPTYLAGLKAGAFGFFPNLPALIAEQRQLGDRAVVGQAMPGGVGRNVVDTFTLSDILKWDITDNLSVKNIASYTEAAQANTQDYGGTPDPLLYVVQPLPPPTETYTEELQLSGKALADNLTWQGGTFLSFNHPAGIIYSKNAQVALGNANGTTSMASTGRTQAIYAQGTYDLGGLASVLTDLKLTAGYRYTWDWRSQWSYQRTNSGACSLPTATQANCASATGTQFHAPGYTLSLDYQLTPEALLYVTSREAYSSGLFNLNAPPPDNIVQPEYIRDVEVGAKLDWNIDGIKARTNFAAFNEWYKNIQRNVAFSYTDSTGALHVVSGYQNAATATIQGLEFQGMVVPFDGLTLTGNYQYIYGHYNTYNAGTNAQLTTLVSQPLTNLAKNKFTLSGRYQLPLDDSIGSVSISGSYTWQTHIYIAPDADPFAIASGYSMTQARVDWNDALGYPVDLSAFVTNLEDTKYTAGILTLWASEGFYAKAVGEPRMFGVELRYRFGPETAPKAETETPYTPPPVTAPEPVPAAPRSYMVFFDFNKSDLTPEAAGIVAQAAKNAGPAKITQLTVTGHTDTAGSDAYNMRLSRRRAESVAAELEKDGIPSGEIEIIAKGKRDLLVSTGDGVRQPQNRRVQIVYSAGASSCAGDDPARTQP